MVAAVKRPRERAPIVDLAARVFAPARLSLVAPGGVGEATQGNLWGSASDPSGSHRGSQLEQSREAADAALERDVPAVPDRAPRAVGNAVARDAMAAYAAALGGLVLSKQNPWHPARIDMRTAQRSALARAFELAAHRLEERARVVEVPALFDVHEPGAPPRRHHVVGDAGDEYDAPDVRERKATRAQRLRDERTRAGEMEATARRFRRRASNIRNCGWSAADTGGAMVRAHDGSLVGDSDGRPYLYGERCSVRWCPSCGRRDVERRRRAVEPLMKRDGVNASDCLLVTLTRRASPDESFADAYDALAAGLDKLKRSRRFRNMFRAGLAGIEATWSTPASRQARADKYAARVAFLEDRAGALWDGDTFIGGGGTFKGYLDVKRDLDDVVRLSRQVNRLRDRTVDGVTRDGRRSCATTVDIAGGAALVVDDHGAYWDGEQSTGEANENSGSHWHVHIHLVLVPRDKCRNARERESLRDVTQALWCASLGVDTSDCDARLERPRKALHEVVKYVIKGSDVVNMPADRLVEMLTHLEGRKLLRVLGQWYSHKEWRDGVETWHETPQVDERDLGMDPAHVVGFALDGGEGDKVTRGEVEIRHDERTRAIARALLARWWEAKHRGNITEAPAEMPRSTPSTATILGDDRPVFALGLRVEHADHSERGRAFDVVSRGEWSVRRCSYDRVARYASTSSPAPTSTKEKARVTGTALKKAARAARIMRRSRELDRARAMKQPNIEAIMRLEGRVHEYRPHLLLDVDGKLIRRLTDEEAEIFARAAHVVERTQQHDERAGAAHVETNARQSELAL